MEETLSIQQLEGHLKKHILKTVITSVISACILAIGVGIAFYYRTNFAIEDITKTDISQTTQINVLNDVVGKMGTPITINGVQISNLESQVKEVKSDIKEVNAKLDRILENQKNTK